MGSARPKDSWTTRTVQGPRRHNTRRISSSAFVGRGGVGRGMGRFAMNRYSARRGRYTKVFVAEPILPRLCRPGFRRATRDIRAAVGNGTRWAVARGRQRAAGFFRWVYSRYSSPYILINSKKYERASGPINRPRMPK